MHVAIFGASGFIGQHLARAFRARGDDVVGFDVRATEGVAALDVVHDPIALDGVDVVFYLSQSPHYRAFPHQGEDLFGVNTIGPLRTARAAVDAGARAFVFASTGNVYAPSFAPLKESDPLRRDDPYALSKVAGEEVLGLFDGTLQITLARLFGVFGPAQKGMLVPTIIDRVMNGLAVTLAPSPTAGVDGGLHVSLADVDDLTRAFADLADAGVAGPEGGINIGGPVNIAGPEAISIERLARTVGEITGREPMFVAADTPRPFDLDADITRFRSLLNPSFTPFEESVARVLAAHV